MKERVLIVDDEVEICEMIGFPLEEAGYEVLVAYNVAQAKSLMQIRKFDLIISDLQMPDGDGLDVFRFIRESSQVSGFVLMSGAIESLTPEMQEVGIRHFFKKPINFNTLVEDVEQIIEKNQSKVA